MRDALLGVAATLPVLLLLGCASPSFEDPLPGDFRGADPSMVAADFASRVATDFELIESATFRFFGKSFAGIGYVAVSDEEPPGRYALSCMTPAGIKVFEFRGRGEEVETLFLPEPLTRHGDAFERAVARDVRRIYLDWTPPPGARAKVRRDRVVFRGETDGGRVEYVYSGRGRTLTEKRFSKGWRTRCLIRYFDYREVDGKLHPFGVVLKNGKYHYRLVLRVKDVLRDGDEGAKE